MIDLVAIGSYVFHDPKTLAHNRGRDLDVVGRYDAIQFFLQQHDVISMWPAAENKIIAKVRNCSYQYIEAEIAWTGSSADMLLNIISEDPVRYTVMTPFEYLRAVNFDIALVIKLSHRFKKNTKHFLKTMGDIQYLRSFGAKFPDEFYDFFRKREQETYTYSHPKLNMSKKEFFNDNVNYIYDHDSLHEVVKMGPVPAYTLFAKDVVMSSREKFFDLSFSDQINAVLEESLVLALERSVIPFGTKPERAFLLALEKVCTSITSGWFREFAWDNYDRVWAQYYNTGYNYVEKFEKAKCNKEVKLHGN